jgi:predicted membrane channel-forming protein YqfA (hemolysin III family)
MADPELARERVEQQERSEGLKERLEREHGELIQELRALIPGAQVLLGFLLAIRFTQQFGDLTDTQRYVYYVTLLSTAAALVFFLAPSAYHRVRFRAGDKEYMMTKGNREAIAGSVATSIALTGVIYLVTDLVFGTVQAVIVAAVFFALIAWLWWAIALYRAYLERRDGGSAPDRR